MKITKDYGNSCLNYCVLYLFQHETVAFQNFTILFLPFPSLFSLIITTLSHQSYRKIAQRISVVTTVHEKYLTFQKVTNCKLLFKFEAKLPILEA